MATGLQPGGAEAVDRRAARSNGTSAGQRSIPCNIHAGFSLGHAAAHEHVFDGCRLDSGLGDGMLDSMTSERSAVRGVKATTEGLRESRPCSGDDDHSPRHFE